MDGRTSQTHKKTAVLILLACAVVLAAFGCLMVGSSGMTVSACLDALLGAPFFLILLFSRKEASSC